MFSTARQPRPDVNTGSRSLEDPRQGPVQGEGGALDRKKKVGNYLLGKVVGEGAFSKVRQGLHIIAREKVSGCRCLPNSRYNIL